MSAQAYLGDGVHASFDGHHVWLTTEVDGRTHSIALEGPVLIQLDDFTAAVKRGEVEPTEAPR